MSIASAIASALLAAAISYAAARKLTHRPEVVAEYARAGVPEGWLDRLAVVLFAAAAGLLAGIAWRPIGIAAAIGLALYFAVAAGFHVRTRDFANVATPIALEILAIATIVLGVASD